MATNGVTDRTTDTPRVDAIALRHVGSMSLNEAHAQFNDLLDLAWQLERELAEAKKPPPCQPLSATEGWRTESLNRGARPMPGKKMDSGFVSIDSLTVPRPTLK